MWKNTEIEAKFEVSEDRSNIVDDIQSFASALRGTLPDYHLEIYKKAHGTDKFVNINDKIVRYRNDAVTKEICYDSVTGFIDIDDTKSWMQELTYKERKTDKNLFNRVEVNLRLNLGGSDNSEDIDALLKVLDIKPLYEIKKAYNIWYISDQKKGIHLCLAEYVVSRLDGSDKHQFVEIEVEKNSDITQREGEKVLKEWVKVLKDRFGFQDPVNISLSELYAPK